MSVLDRMTASEAVGPGSIPGRATFNWPASVPDRTADFDSARRGSTPQQGTETQYVLGVCRIRTRPREGRGSGSIPGKGTFTTLEPDGTATGCNPVEVGSTPTGVSDRPTAGSDYINC